MTAPTAAYDRIAAFADEMRDWRRDIHAHPELGFEETRTSALVAERLKDWGIETHTGIATTGVVGVIRGRGNAGGAIGLRADLDALPMNEEGTPEYRSTAGGRMHACGHDGHTAMLLGAARYLAETRAFDGTVNVIFQPAEENAGGGRVMVDEGVFDRFPCDAVYGMHNMTHLPKGTFGIRPGAFLAAVDAAVITIEGEGGHAAWPHKAVDPIAVGAQVHAALQTIVSRGVDPIQPAVVSVTQFHGGSANNVIPSSAWLDVSIRTLDPGVRGLVETRIREVCDGVARAHGARIGVDYTHGYPAVMNHPAETEAAGRAAASLVGEANVDPDHPPIMGSEDFAYMLEAKPGAYILIGIGDDDHVHPVHHPGYDFNDDVLALGASYWARLAEQELPLAGGD